MKMAAPKKLSRSRLGNLVVFLLLGLMGVFTAIPFIFSIVQSIVGLIVNGIATYTLQYNVRTKIGLLGIKIEPK